MGYLIHILLALAIQGAVELATPGSGWPAERERPMLVLALVLVPLALGRWTRRAYFRGRFRTATVLQGATLWSPVALQGAALLLLGWNGTVERWTGARPELLDWPHVALLMALAPFAVMMLVSIDARARLYGPARRSSVRRFHARMFATGLLPIAAFIVCAWVVGLEPRLRVNLQEVGLYAGAFAVVLLALFLLGLPWVVRNVWETSPLPRGYQRDLVEGFARHVDLRCGDIRVWGTGNQMSNAAVVGVGPQRVVLLSDALLAELPPRELAAVFAHEAAHVKRHHVLVFLAWSVAFFVTADLVTVWAGIESELSAALVVGFVFFLWYLAFGWLSRRFELEADLWSAEKTGDPAALASALERVGSTHGRSTGWRHFSTDDRIAFLRRAELDPSEGRRLRTTLRRAGRLAALAAVLAVGLELWTLLDQLDEDRLRVDLRLGDYTSAQARLEGLPDPDPDLERSLSRVLELPEPRTVEAVTAAAQAAERAGDREAAADLAELAVLRDGDLEALRALLDPEG